MGANAPVLGLRYAHLLILNTPLSTALLIVD